MFTLVLLILLDTPVVTAKIPVDKFSSREECEKKGAEMVDFLDTSASFANATILGYRCTFLK